MPDRENLSRAIEALEAQRATLGDDVVEAALVPLREALAAAQAEVLGEQRKLVTILFADLAGRLIEDVASGIESDDLRNSYLTRLPATSAILELCQSRDPHPAAETHQ